GPFLLSQTGEKPGPLCPLSREKAQEQVAIGRNSRGRERGSDRGRSRNRYHGQARRAYRGNETGSRIAHRGSARITHQGHVPSLPEDLEDVFGSAIVGVGVKTQGR